MKVKTQKIIFLTKEDEQAMKKVMTMLCDLSEKLDLRVENIFIDLKDSNFKFIYPQEFYKDEDAYPVIVTK